MKYKKSDYLAYVAYLCCLIMAVFAAKFLQVWIFPNVSVWVGTLIHILLMWIFIIIVVYLVKRAHKYGQIKAREEGENKSPTAK